MPSTFTIRNTGNVNLEVEHKGESGQGQGGPTPTPHGQGQGQHEDRSAELSPGEERTYTVDKNSHVQIREGGKAQEQAQPKR